MNRSLKTILLGAGAALMLGGAAQAGEYGRYDGGDDGYRHVRYERVDAGGYDERRYLRRDPDRYYGRPVPDRDDWERRRWHRPVVERPYWRGDEGCTVIIKKRINHWGERVVTRIKRCG